MKAPCLVFILLVLPVIVSADSCSDLKKCLKSIIGKRVKSPDPTATNEDFCDALTEAFQGKEGIEKVCSAAKRFETRRNLGRYWNTRQYAKKGDAFGSQKKKTGNLFGGTTTPEPACLDPFDPFYADESGVGTSYDTYMLSIEGLYLFDGKLERANDDAYAELKIGWSAALTAAALATELPLAATAANEVLSIFEITIDQIDTHDGSIDSSEIEATFENSQLILTQTCNMIGQIDQIQASIDTRLHQIENRLDAVEETLQERLGRIEDLLNTLVYSY